MTSLQTLYNFLIINQPENEKRLGDKYTSFKCSEHRYSIEQFNLPVKKDLLAQGYFVAEGAVVGFPVHIDNRAANLTAYFVDRAKGFDCINLPSNTLFLAFFQFTM